jgi:hypothetical protein
MYFNKISYEDYHHIQIGKIGEYWMKLCFSMLNLDVYTTEVDNKGIDFIVRLDDSNYIDIQVKTIRKSKTSYVYVDKEDKEVDWKDVLRKNRFLAIVIIEDYKIPSSFLIPATEWNNPNELLKIRNYKSNGLKSKDDWGVNISKKNMELLQKYELAKSVIELKEKYKCI